MVIDIRILPTMGILMGITQPGCVKIANWKPWPIEIVDLPFLKLVIFHSHVKLPEGKILYTWLWIRK